MGASMKRERVGLVKGLWQSSADGGGRTGHARRTDTLNSTLATVGDSHDAHYGSRVAAPIGLWSYNSEPAARGQPRDCGGGIVVSSSAKLRRRYTPLAVERRACAAAVAQRPRVLWRRRPPRMARISEAHGTLARPLAAGPTVTRSRPPSRSTSSRPLSA